MTICIWATLWKRSFKLGPILFLQISMTICIWFFGRGVFNYDFIFSYKFLWRSASGNSLKEEFSIRISSFPTNSYDDLHLATLWKRSFQLRSHLCLQIPMTICIWQLFVRGVFNYDLFYIPINSYDDTASGYSFEEEFSSRIAPFPYKFLWRSASGYSLEEEFSIRISSFPTKFLWRSASGQLFGRRVFN